MPSWPEAVYATVLLPAIQVHCPVEGLNFQRSLRRPCVPAGVAASAAEEPEVAARIGPTDAEISAHWDIGS